MSDEYDPYGFLFGGRPPEPEPTTEWGREAKAALGSLKRLDPLMTVAKSAGRLAPMILGECATICLAAAARFDKARLLAEKNNGAASVAQDRQVRRKVAKA